MVLEILDARDPVGTRATDLEDKVAAAAGKKLILVLNKIDLIPNEVCDRWLKYLRQFFPVIPFKACTQKSGTLGESVPFKATRHAEASTFGSRSVGGEQLLQLLKNYSRNEDIKTAITVGVIGYPNVGKSSVINSMKRVRSCGVSPVSGFTKVMQEVILDRKIRLLDCPGIVFEDQNENSVILRNCINVEAMHDPVPAAQMVLERCEDQVLMDLYDVPPFKDIYEFLGNLGRKTRLQGKGGHFRHERSRPSIYSKTGTPGEFTTALIQV